MKSIYKILNNKVIAIAMTLCFYTLVCQAQGFRVVRELDRLPFKEVTSIYRDNEGVLWIATRNGLYAYDGYHIRPYRCDDKHPDLISDNYVARITEDRQNRLWINTETGLDRLNKLTNEIEHLHPKDLPVDSISQMYAMPDSSMWFACYNGFYKYNPKDKSYSRIPITDDEGKRIDVNAQCIFMDHRGYIWLGTWNTGLYRYNESTKELVHYPQMNRQNSAHVIIEDEQKRIWIAGWGGGVHVLNNAWDIDNLSWETYKDPDLIGDITYCLTLDQENHQLYIGSSRGITVASTERLGEFNKLINTTDGQAIPGVEVSGIELSPNGLIWVGMIGQGVTAIEPDNKRFGRTEIRRSGSHVNTSSIRSIYCDRDNNLWLGIGTQGLAVVDHKTGRTYNWDEIPALRDTHLTMSTVYAITQTYDGHVWVATYGAELIELVLPQADKDIRSMTCSIYSLRTFEYSPSDHVFNLMEDSNDNLWITGHHGVALRRPDGTFVHLDSLQMDATRKMFDLDVRNTALAADGSVWISSLHHGVYCMRQNGSEWLIKGYNTELGNIGDNEIQCILCDSHNNVWAGSNYGTLYLLDQETDKFVSLRKRITMPGAAIVFLHEAQYENNNEYSIWAGTNEGLLQVQTTTDQSSIKVEQYTTDDGLLDNHLIRNSVSSRDNIVWFGTHKGYNFFDARQLAAESHRESRLMLGELLIGDICWRDLPVDVRTKISEYNPKHLQKIELQPDQNNFAFEFVQPDNRRQKGIRYAYRLEGYDSQWRYTLPDQQRVYYANVPSGNYMFTVYEASQVQTNTHTTDADQSTQLKFQVVIHPSWWNTRLAQFLYWVLSFLAIFLIYRGVRSLKKYYVKFLIRARERHAMRKGDIIIKTADKQPEIANADKDFIEHAIRLQNKHMSDSDYDQQQFLDDMGVSKATCFRKLKSLTGQSYTQFVRELKMNAAMRIQKENPDTRISDLAYAVGFNDPKYFSICFKKHFGILPSEVKKD